MLGPSDEAGFRTQIDENMRLGYQSDGVRSLLVSAKASLRAVAVLAALGIVLWAALMFLDLGGFH